MFFSLPVGRACHNSPLMVNRRQEHKREVEVARQRAIADRNAQIAKLQSKINSIEKSIRKNSNILI